MSKRVKTAIALGLALGLVSAKPAYDYGSNAYEDYAAGQEVGMCYGMQRPLAIFKVISYDKLAKTMRIKGLAKLGPVVKDFDMSVPLEHFNKDKTAGSLADVDCNGLGEGE